MSRYGFEEMSDEELEGWAEMLGDQVAQYKSEVAAFGDAGPGQAACVPEANACWAEQDRRRKVAPQAPHIEF